MIDFIPVVGALTLFAAAWLRNPVVRFRKDKIVTCLGYNWAAIIVFAIFLSHWFPPDVSYDLEPIPWLRVFLAGLEDAVFVLPVFFIPKPSARIFFLAYSAVVFSSGHAYQGDLSALAKIPTVFVTYWLAGRFGILTTIVAHSLNDIMAFSLIALLQGAMR